MNMTREQIDSIIEAVVRDRFADVQIESVSINPETDYDGDLVFRVTVVFDSEAGRLDAHKTAGITRHIRHRLLAEKEDAFPILTFMSKRDAAAAA
jgi:hypothetical protein